MQERNDLMHGSESGGTTTHAGWPRWQAGGRKAALQAPQVNFQIKLSHH